MTVDSMFRQLKEKGYVEAETQDAPRYKIGDISQATGLQKTANGWVKPKGQGGSNENSNSSAGSSAPKEHASFEDFRKNAKTGDFKKNENGSILVKLKGGSRVAHNEDELKEIYGKLKMEVPDIKKTTTQKTTNPSAPAKTEKKKKKWIPVGTVNSMYVGTSMNSV